MFHQKLFEVDIMNINLKKIKILEPKVKIGTKSFIAIERTKTVAQAGNAALVGAATHSIFGVATFSEIS